MTREMRQLCGFVITMSAVVVVIGASLKDGTLFGPTVAAWVQGLGTIAAVFYAARIATRERRERDERQRERRDAARRAIMAQLVAARDAVAAYPGVFHAARNTGIEIGQILGAMGLMAAQLERAPLVEADSQALQHAALKMTHILRSIEQTAIKVGHMPNKPATWDQFSEWTQPFADRVAVIYQEAEQGLAEDPGAAS